MSGPRNHPASVQGVPSQSLFKSTAVSGLLACLWSSTQGLALAHPWGVRSCVAWQTRSPGRGRTQRSLMAYPRPSHNDQLIHV